MGFLALLGGIVMFLYVVPKDLDPGAAPRDATVLSTEVYLQELRFFEVHHRYAASLAEVNVDRDLCDRYHCRLTLQADALSYIFRFTKDDKTWMIDPKSPVPKREKP